MIYRFANCLLDSDRRTLLRGDAPVHVEPQVFDLLLLLAQHTDRVVSKDELVETVWRGLNVSDATIAARVSLARKAVGDDGREQAIIRTVHGRGVQLVADLMAEQPAAPATQRGTKQSIHFARSALGARIAYAKSGEGPPLVRVGHWLSHLELDWLSPVWRPLLDALGRDHTLYRYDQRGTGLSSRSLEGADLDAFTDDLVAVADANGLQRFPIFAASQAVPVAIRCAERFPDRVTGLILYGGFAVGRALRPASPDDIDEDTLLALIKAGWGKAGSPFVNAFSALSLPDATPEQMDSFIKMQTETISPENAARLRQIVDRFDVQDSLASVHAPTLVLHALSDAMQPIEQGRVLASEIPNAEYVALQSRNHIPLPQEQSWTQLVSEVEMFLRRIGS